MIWVEPEYEARKIGAFELCQEVKKLVSDKSLASEVWAALSEVTILALKPVKGTAII